MLERRFEERRRTPDIWWQSQHCDLVDCPFSATFVLRNHRVNRVDQNFVWGVRFGVWTPCHRVVKEVFSPSVVWTEWHDSDSSVPAPHQTCSHILVSRYTAVWKLTVIICLLIYSIEVYSISITKKYIIQVLCLLGHNTLWHHNKVQYCPLRVIVTY